MVEVSIVRKLNGMIGVNQSGLTIGSRPVDDGVNQRATWDSSGYGQVGISSVDSLGQWSRYSRERTGREHNITKEGTSKQVFRVALDCFGMVGAVFVCL